ncbi:MAG TPA: SEC-C metal-binding domain-containing protein [Thermoanaerobaculia bacterium]|nr:SEC-C metal-binding domain-containing protein [Thermoanaerobaculia bacterium]
MARVSRNDPCPCGSGLKYKRCHEGKDVEKPRSSGLLLMALLALVIGAGAVAVVVAVSRGPSAASPVRRRVWSPEHGHWHDEGSPVRSSGGVPFDPRSALPSGPRPAPAGTPPPGKVWSPEHGHWHDVVGRNGSTNAPPPIGITYGPAPNR